MREVVSKLASMGRLPDEGSVDQADLDERVTLLDEVGLEQPSRDEVLALLPLFPADDNPWFELARTLLLIIGSSPDWPMWPALDDLSGEWAETLTIRLENAGETRPEAPELNCG